MSAETRCPECGEAVTSGERCCGVRRLSRQAAPAELDFSLASSIAALTEAGGDPRCGHCTTVLREVGLSLGDTFAIEHRRGHVDEVTFTLSTAIAKLLLAAGRS